MSADTAWLIEHTHDPRYGRESWYSGKDGFTIDSLQAVRFARKEDAVREIERFPATLAKNLIAAHHSWIPARVCPHGQLQRQCEICEATEEAAHWRSKAENAFEPIRKIADALAQGGFHCHDKPGFVADHVPSLVNEAITELKIAQATVAQLRTELSFESRRLNALWSGEKVLRERAESRFAAVSAELDSAKIAASDTLARLTANGMREAAEIARNFRPKSACTCGGYISFHNGIPGHQPGCLVGECLEIADEIDARADEIDETPDRWLAELDAAETKKP